MRIWRKIESSILTSSRLASLSDSAKWLFTLLLVAQDDEGKYPWTQPRIKALIATTDWDSVAYESLLSELRVAGIAELKEGYVVLLNGAEKNGTPANSKQYPMLYPPLADLGTESLTSRERVVSDKESEVRVEKSRVEKIPPIVPQTGDAQQRKAKRHTPSLKTTTTQELLAMFSEDETTVIASRFPGLDLEWEAGKCVEWHNARGGSGNWKLALKNWLDRWQKDSERRSNNGRNAQPGRRAERAGARFDNSHLKFLRMALHDMPPPSPEREAQLLEQIAEEEKRVAAQ